MTKPKLPQHITHVPENRENAPLTMAWAPYNFVPLPDEVVPAEEVAPEERVPARCDKQGKVVEEYSYSVCQDTYHKSRLTGTIVCTLITETPVYVRCALTTAQFQQAEIEKRPEHSDKQSDWRQLAKNIPDFFYTADKETPVIPGSSLRGLLRTLVEIASYGKMDRVTDHPRYFFRAVAAKRDDPLAQPYRNLLKNVCAGYLEQRSDGWYICPATTIDGETFLKVRERDIPPKVGLDRLNHDNYKPQYIAISFTHKNIPDKRSGENRLVIDQIGKPGIYQYEGMLVTSGNMLETGRKNRKTVSPRRNHCVVPARNANAEAIKIDDNAINAYRVGLTEFQKGPTDIKPTSVRPFSETDGVLKNGRPIFYCEPPAGESEVHFFGHSPNFRIPYWPDKVQRAATPADFVPLKTRRGLDDKDQPPVTDIAEAIFGHVSRNSNDDPRKPIAGRVFISDATFQHDQGNPWLDESGAPIVPMILSSPKPTTFQHYLVQTSSQQRELKHYASTPESETVIRGHKLYWHQAAVDKEKIEDTEFLQKPEQEQIKDTQHTQFKPVKPHTKFDFTIHFENLSQIELGSLLWVLRIAADKDYRLKLGMGKPLGMGAVQITSTVHLSDRVTRYATLFDDDTWATGESQMSEQQQEECITTFEAYVLKHSCEKTSRLKDTLRMQCLLELLKWPGPSVSETRYMQIEPQNEYRNRPVLPSPLQVTSTIPDGNTNPTASLPTYKTETPPKPRSESRLPTVGEYFRGEITDIDNELGMVLLELPESFEDSSGVTILISPALREQTLVVIPKRHQTGGGYRVGNTRWVEVIAVRQKGRLLEVKPVQRPTRS